MLTFPDIAEDGATKVSGATSDTAPARFKIDLCRYTAIAVWLSAEHYRLVTAKHLLQWQDTQEKASATNSQRLPLRSSR